MFKRILVVETRERASRKTGVSAKRGTAAARTGRTATSRTPSPRVAS